MTVRLFEQFSSLGDTIRKGASDRDRYNVDMAQLGLKETQMLADIERQKRQDALAMAADERAKTRAAQETAEFEAEAPVRQARAEEAQRVNEAYNAPFMVKDIVGESKTGIEHLYTPDEEGQDIVNKIGGLLGARVEKDPTSPYMGGFVDAKTGKSITHGQAQKYMPQIQEIIFANTDPKKYIESQIRRNQEKFDKGQIKKDEYLATQKELSNLTDDQAMLRAYQSKKSMLAGLKGKEGELARSRTEAKISEITKRLDERAKEEREYANEIKKAMIVAGSKRDFSQADALKYAADKGKYINDGMKNMPKNPANEAVQVVDKDGQLRDATQKDLLEIKANLAREFDTMAGLVPPQPPPPKLSKEAFIRDAKVEYPKITQEQLDVAWSKYSGEPVQKNVKQQKQIETPKIDQPKGLPKNIDLSFYTATPEQRAAGMENTFSLLPKAYLAQVAQQEAIRNKRNRRALEMVR